MCGRAPVCSRSRGASICCRLHLIHEDRQHTRTAAIDVHCQLFPDSYLGFVRERNRAGDARLTTHLSVRDGVEWLANPDMPQYPMTPDFRDPAEVVAWMDRAGVTS